MIVQIFELVLIPLLTIVTIFLINWINTKTKELKNKIDNDLINKTLDQTSKLIIDCIQTTNQTYVNSLKEQGKFDKEAQIIAFNKTYTAVLAVLTDSAKEILISAVGDLNVYITNEIESTILKIK